MNQWTLPQVVSLYFLITFCVRLQRRMGAPAREIRPQVVSRLGWLLAPQRSRGVRAVSLCNLREAAHFGSSLMPGRRLSSSLLSSDYRSPASALEGGPHRHLHRAHPSPDSRPVKVRRRRTLGRCRLMAVLPTRGWLILPYN
jgi:hypothetical protein